MSQTLIGSRAVVLGGSMAGLLAARVLADRYEEVTVVERDPLDTTTLPRKGVPQGRHIHGLMAAGQQAMEELFPGLVDDLRGRGVPVLDQLAQARIYLSGHRLRPAPSGIVVLSASRPLLEGYLRQRVRALPGVTFLGSCDAVGLASTRDRSRVTGARVLRRADGSAGEVLPADLVVDATGRGSRAPVWLERLGYGRPGRDTISIGVRYASGMFRLPPGALGDDLAVISAPTPAARRGGGLAAVEGDRCVVTLMGVLGDQPPTDLGGFRAFARSLPFPDIHEAIRDAELLDPLVAHRFPASVRHRYERLPRLPDGLVVIGDALSSFNPVYGQGMTVAALEALALRTGLANGRGPAARSRALMRGLARVVDVPWDLAAGGDLAYRGVQGDRTLKVRMGNAYIPRVHAAAAHDPALGIAFLRVAGMLDRPGRLLRPDVMLRVLRRTVA